MRRVLGSAAGALILVFVFCISSGAAEAQPKFIGVARCKICHMSKKKGNQYGVWKNSKHAQAYQVLTTEEAEKAAKKADKPPAENPACLKCHVTGWDAPDDLKGSKWDKTEGVTCEACHGAGGDYSPMKVMKDKELALQKGLVIPKKEHCQKCHNKESPTYKPFDFDTFWKKIAHDNPLTK